MAPQTLASFNASELSRNIENLKEAKHACTFKLNLLRGAAIWSPAHLPIFDELEDQLFNAAHKIYELEASEKERNKLKVVRLGVGQAEDDDGDVIRSELKKAMGLISVFDTLGEDVARLKFTLDMESEAKAGKGAAIKACSTVAAHFRKNPKRKAKIGEQKEGNEGPARYEIIHLLE